MDFDDVNITEDGLNESIDLKIGILETEEATPEEPVTIDLIDDLRNTNNISTSEIPSSSPSNSSFLEISNAHFNYMSHERDSVYSIQYKDLRRDPEEYMIFSSLNMDGSANKLFLH